MFESVNVVAFGDDFYFGAHGFTRLRDVAGGIASTRPSERAGDEEPGDESFECAVLLYREPPVVSECNLEMSMERFFMEMQKMLEWTRWKAGTKNSRKSSEKTIAEVLGNVYIVVRKRQLPMENWQNALRLRSIESIDLRSGQCLYLFIQWRAGRTVPTKSVGIDL